MIHRVDATFLPFRGLGALSGLLRQKIPSYNIVRCLVTPCLLLVFEVEHLSLLCDI
jgi:hypothetical protein